LIFRDRLLAFELAGTLVTVDFAVRFGSLIIVLVVHLGFKQKKADMLSDYRYKVVVKSTV
jgi:hypothetical protein